MLYQVGLNEGTLEQDGFVFETVKGKNIIRLADDVTLDDVRFVRDAAHLRIVIEETVAVDFLQHGDSVFSVDELVFSDGSRFDINGSLHSKGTEGNDVFSLIHGFNDTIEGLGGDDLIYNQADGYDITFVIGRNDGNDTIEGYPVEIKLTDGITQDNVRYIFEIYKSNYAVKMFIDETSSVLIPYYSTLQPSVLTGTSGNDNIWTPDDGNGYAFTLKGLGGNDTLTSYSGSDILIGGSGDDVMNAGSAYYGHDTYIIGLKEGNDTISAYNVYDYQNTIVQFGEGIHPEDLTYEGINTWQYGYKIIINIGGVSSVTIDNLEQGYAMPTLRFNNGEMLNLKDVGIRFYFPKTGTDGNDRMNGTDFHDRFTGLGGDDTLTGAKGNDTLDGGEGNDSINGGFNNDLLLGGSGNDTLLGGDQDDSLQGDGGDDFLNGQGGKDFIVGGEGNDTILGEGFNDTLYGGSGNDSIDGGQQNDVLYGEDGLDTLLGANGNDTLFGGADGDSIVAGAGADSVDAGAGDDTVTGGTGNDILLGGDGNDGVRGNEDADSIVGGSGMDTLTGGRGGDILAGGADADRFVFEVISDSYSKVVGGIDTISDFEQGVDLLILTGLRFTGLDTDGGFTEKGELRLAYDALANVTHIISDQTKFDVALTGDYSASISNTDFVF